MIARRLLAVLCLPAALAAQPKPIFRFTTDEIWLNLHHFLYVLGRAQAGLPDSSREAVVKAPADAERGLARRSAAEQRAWRDAVSFYANGLAKKDLIFDDPLPEVTRTLADAADAASLRGRNLDSALVSALERAMPVYRKTWWAEHRAANVAWRDDAQASLDRHGSAVLAFITKVYGMPWPADGYPVHLSGYSNWAGAYSTRGNLLVVSGLDTSTRGAAGLETVFHEAMHQWDSPMFLLLRDQARKIDKLVPGSLTHAMIFYTAGDAVRRVVPGYVPYADAAGVWGRGMAPLKEALKRTWQPYLDGQSTRDDALARLIAETATQRRP